MRTLEEINDEYSRLSLEYGDLEYKKWAINKNLQEQIKQIQDKLVPMQDKMLALNQEAATIMSNNNEEANADQKPLSS